MALRLLGNQNKITLSLITTPSRLKILLSILYMGEMKKWIIFKEIITLLNLFLVYTFFIESLYVLIT